MKMSKILIPKQKQCISVVDQISSSEKNESWKS